MILGVHHDGGQLSTIQVAGGPESPINIAIHQLSIGNSCHMSGSPRSNSVGIRELRNVSGSGQTKRIVQDGSSLLPSNRLVGTEGTIVITTDDLIRQRPSEWKERP